MEHGSQLSYTHFTWNRLEHSEHTEDGIKFTLRTFSILIIATQRARDTSRLRDVGLEIEDSLQKFSDLLEMAPYSQHMDPRILEALIR